MLSALKNRPSLLFVVEKAKETAIRFPAALGFSFLVAAYIVFSIENSFKDDVWPLLCSLLLGIPWFLASGLWRESKGLTSSYHKTIDLAVGTAFIIAHYYFTNGDDPENYFFRYFQLSLALHLAVSFIAFLKSSNENEFWQFNRRIFLRILLSGLYAAVLCLGIIVALVAVENLFSVKIKPERYGQVWVVCAVFFQTWHFLAGIPTLSSLREGEAYPKGLRLFVQFLLIPLVSLYMVILYSYMGKILYTQNWPSGYIGWLVSVMSVLGIFNLLLIYPEGVRAENRWIAAYSKYYYILILPLLAMLFIAVGKRVSEYGLTEPRYFLIILGILLSGLALYFIVSAEKRIKVIPISLFVIAVVSYGGPWSGYSLSLRDQKARALEIMQRNKILTDGVGEKRTDVSFKDQKDLSSIFNYIIQSHGSKELPIPMSENMLKKLEAASYSKYARSQNSEPVMKYLRLSYVTKWETGDRYADSFFYNTEAVGSVIPVHGYHYTVNINSGDFETKKSTKIQTFELKPGQLSITFDKEAADFILWVKPGKTLTIKTSELLARLRKIEQETGNRTYGLDESKIEAQGQGIKARFYLVDASGEYKEKESKLHISRVSGILLFSFE